MNNLYNAIVLDHFNNPLHVGELTASNKLRLRQGNTQLGAVVQLDILFDANQSQIIDIAFKAYGNPYLIAGMSWTCDWLLNKTLEQATRLDYQQLIELLEIPASRHHSAIIIEDIVKNAIDKLSKAKLSNLSDATKPEMQTEGV